MEICAVKAVCSMRAVEWTVMTQLIVALRRFTVGV